MIRALTLTQPWASLVAIGAKRLETRGWSTSHRGPLAIHAAKGWTRDDQALCLREPFASELVLEGIRKIRDLPLGAIVATAWVDRCIRSEDFELFAKEHSECVAQHERDFGNYLPGRFFFVLKNVQLKNVQRLAAPIPCKGALGLWTVPVDVEAQIRERQGVVAP